LPHEQLVHDLFALSPAVRYVAVRSGDALELHQRPGLAAASSSESDRYEELLVNPTLLTLAGERGRIDCGGLEFILVRYGSFFQLVHPVKGGHVSVAVELDGEPLSLVPRIREILAARGLRPAD